MVLGKLKASQLININTAALLPGARPSKSEPILSSSAEPKSEPEHTNPYPEHASGSPLFKTPVESPNVSDMSQKSLQIASLLPSINKVNILSSAYG